MYARTLIHNNVHPIPIEIKLFRESLEELLTHYHIEKSLSFIVLRVQVLIEFLLGVELYCIFAPHELVRDRSTDRRSKPIVDAINLVDSLLMRHVSLAQNANIFEADEVKGFVHACATVDTEECMSVSAFLSSLDLDKDWVLKTALLSLLLI